MDEIDRALLREVAKNPGAIASEIVGAFIKNYIRTGKLGRESVIGCNFYLPSNSALEHTDFSGCLPRSVS